MYETGAENGSSSQGTAGQSGPMAGSTGGVSKAAKGQGSAEKEEQTGNQKRARRQWESWSAEDKNSFFEGLYEVRVCIYLFRMRPKGFAVIVRPLSLLHPLLVSLLLLSTARERLWSNPEQYCHEVQEKRQTSSHGEEQGAGPPFLLQNLAQDLQTHWLCQRWAALCLCHLLTSRTSLIICEQFTTQDFFYLWVLGFYKDLPPAASNSI